VQWRVKLLKTKEAIERPTMNALEGNSALRSALQENLSARDIREVAATEKPGLSFLSCGCVNTNKERYD